MATSTAAARVLMTGRLDADDALTLLEQVVSESGTKHEVMNCVYFQGSDSDEAAATPVCIVGHVLDKLGKNLGDLSDLDCSGASVHRINTTDFSSLGVDALDITDDARGLLYEAQMQQDGNRTNDRSWGAALEAAHFHHKHRRGIAILAAAA